MAPFSHAIPRMRTTTTLESYRTIDWRGILVGGGLAIAFMFVASMIGAFIRVPAAALLIAAVAFLAVGMLTLRIRPGTNPLSPAIGAAVATAILSFFPILFSPETAEALTPGQIAISVIVSLLFAFSLAWIGARLMQQRERDELPPRSAAHRDAPSSV